MSTFVRRIVAKLAFAATGMLAIGTASIGSATPAIADGVLSGPRHILNDNSNQCMAVAYGTMQPGQPVIQWPCTGTLDQEWIPVLVTDNEYVLENFKDPSYCLSNNDGAWFGNQLTIEPCSVLPFGGDVWALTGDVQTTVLKNVDSQLMAAVAAASVSAGAPIIEWGNQVGVPNTPQHFEQQWSLESSCSPICT